MPKLQVIPDFDNFPATWRWLLVRNGKLIFATNNCCCWECTCDLTFVSVNGIILEYYAEDTPTPSGPAGGPYYCGDEPPDGPGWYLVTFNGPFAPFHHYWLHCLESSGGEILFTLTWEYRSGTFDLANNRYPCLAWGQCTFTCADLTSRDFFSGTFVIDCDGIEFTIVLA